MITVYVTNGNLNRYAGGKSVEAFSSQHNSRLISLTIPISYIVSYDNDLNIYTIKDKGR